MPTRSAPSPTHTGTPSASVTPLPLAASESITLIQGCMFSGKTTELLRIVGVAEPESVRVFKHQIDRRYSANDVVSHNGSSHPATPIASASQIVDHIDQGVRIVAVDEAHFFDAEITDVFAALAQAGVHVAATCLDRNCWGMRFSVAKSLGTIAHTTVNLNTACARCGQQADRTQRLTPIIDNNLVGGAESYEPRCATCWTPPPRNDGTLDLANSP